ncbi:hypothetical protein TI39_contig50g00005 [Zymoseptoria brevis]|uniref:DNA2/NAM7 helicase-like C-terminal domain-containing protein n=1 Tax=Zymoseptoria brevis TaxID=1047168 RepID=A0A0F4GYK0_9PEZI|nr:hypothetical protein TI39_contig50g00005 [Zymoseptoria brevis]
MLRRPNPRPRSPLRLPARDDAELFGHLSSLKDAAPVRNTSTITNETTLVVLHSQSTSPHRQGKKTLLENFTGVAEPKVLCQINGGAGGRDWYPKNRIATFHVTFNKLLLAPVVRIEAKLRQPSPPAGPTFPMLVLEFHLNKNDQVEPITDVNLDNHGSITFNTTGATSSGFNHIAKLSQYLSARQREVVDLLLQLRSPESPRAVKVRLDSGSLRHIDRAMLNKIIGRLQGSFADRLSPAVSEYSAFRRPDGTLFFKHYEMQTVKELMEGRYPHPMTALEASDTFSTVAEAQIQLAYSAVVMDAESRATLLLWSQYQHGGFLYNGEDFPVLAVKNSRVSLPGAKGAIKLPDELECKIELFYEEMRAGRKDDVVIRTVGHLLASNPGVPHHDAYFRLGMSKGLCAKIIEARKITEPDKTWIKADLVPHINSFTFSSQLETCQQLGRTCNERWQRILLNQRHETVPEVDVTAMSRMESSLRMKADHWLKTTKPWNEEQMQVIDSTISGKVAGGMSIIMGPAGVGKTTLHIALTLYFWVLGYRVLSLAPANSNCNHVASYINVEELGKDFPGFDVFGFVNSDVLRLFPGSRDVKVKEMTDEQTEHKEVGHKERRVLSLTELVFALQQEKTGFTTAQSRGVVQTVIKLVDDGFRGYNPEASKQGPGPRVDEVLDHHEGLQDSAVSRQEEAPQNETNASVEATPEQGWVPKEDDVNPWDRLREYITLARTLDLKEEMQRIHGVDEAVRKFRRRPEQELNAYQQCLEEIMAHNRFLITTTGNVRSFEMMGFWSTKLPLAVFVDESAKDLEVNVWSAIVCEKWAGMVAGVYLFGDDRQLQPTNTCIRDHNRDTGVHTQYNAYFDRLDISLPCRLVAEGFPFVRLKEQRRMHKCLSDFPNRKVYNGELRDGPGMDKSLEAVRPGLLAVLTDIIAGSAALSLPEREAYLAEASEEKARLHWIEVEGDREKNQSQSWKTENHVQVFFSEIYPKLLAYFKGRQEKMSEFVMLICSYSFTIRSYEDKFANWLRANPDLTVDDQPRLLSVDASQGQESMMVIYDTGLQNGWDLGFLKTPSRINVSITRCRDVLWIIGGTMQLKTPGDRKYLIKQKFQLGQLVAVITALAGVETIVAEIIVAEVSVVEIGVAETIMESSAVEVIEVERSPAEAIVVHRSVVGVTGAGVKLMVVKAGLITTEVIVADCRIDLCQPSARNCESKKRNSASRFSLNGEHDLGVTGSGMGFKVRARMTGRKGEIGLVSRMLWLTPSVSLTVANPAYLNTSSKPSSERECLILSAMRKPIKPSEA